MKRPILDKPRNGETWKSRAVDLATRFEQSQTWIARLNGIIVDSLSGRARFVARTDGEYPSDLGSFWYQTARDGSIVRINHDARDIMVFTSWADVFSLYSTLGAKHNKAAYQVLLSVAAKQERAA